MCPVFCHFWPFSWRSRPPPRNGPRGDNFSPPNPLQNAHGGGGMLFASARENTGARDATAAAAKSRIVDAAPPGGHAARGASPRENHTPPHAVSTRSQTSARHPLAGIRRAQPARKPHLRRPPKARNVWLATRREELGSRRLPNISLEKFPGTALTGFVLWKLAHSLFWPSKSERRKNSPKKNSIQTAWGRRDLRSFLGGAPAGWLLCE